MGNFLDEMDDVCMCFDCNWYFCFDQIHFVREENSDYRKKNWNWNTENNNN